MKTLLWLAAAAGALAAAVTIVGRSQRKQLQRAPLALAGGVPYEIFEAEIIEIVPFDPSGPAMVDETTLVLLEQLTPDGVFTKSRM